MDLKNVYKNMTNVDIEEQKQLWNDRGKGYYGEFLLFSELYKNVSGNCKILMNLNIPVGNGKTTEIDLLMIHETGLYVFEVKHYKGTIYGDDKGEIWTQYFRTVKNSAFKNPILQNEYHLKALKKLFPSVPVKSIIVFTNEDSDIRVENSNLDICVCNLNNLMLNINKAFESYSKRYTLEEIDKMFEEISKYSQMQEEILFDGEKMPFKEWLNPSIALLKEKKSELELEEKSIIEEKESLKKTKFLTVVINIVVAIICVIFSSYCVAVIRENYSSELAKFKQKFLHVDEIDNEYFNDLNKQVEVSEVVIEDFAENAVTFKAKISMKSDIYGIALTKSSKYIVMTESGMTYEYDVFGEHLSYWRSSNMIGKGIREYVDLANAQFLGISKNEIIYIKITDIELFKLNVSRTLVKDELEIELFKK